MTERTAGPHARRARRRGSYGFDAAYVAGAFVANGVVDGLLTWWALRRRRRLIAAVTALGSAWTAVATGSYLYSTRRGKFVVWSEVLDALQLTGEERILDVGCGRGAVLMLAAERLSRGRATGVDVWRSQDQVGNSRTAAERNAVCEGVDDRVELVEGDARALPFPDASFDVVLSNLVVHNLGEATDREAALREMRRVLRPGGRLRVVDLYAAGMRDTVDSLGYENIRAQPVGPRMWFGSPFTNVSLISARKPVATPDG